MLGQREAYYRRLQWNKSPELLPIRQRMDMCDRRFLHQSYRVCLVLFIVLVALMGAIALPSEISMIS